MSTRAFVIALLALLVVYLAADSFYTVRATERAVLLRFGAMQQVDVAAGLHFKLPFAEEVKRFSGQVLTLDSRPERFYTVEKRPLIVDSYVKWRVRDVARYYTATGGDELNAERRLQERVKTGLRNQISRRDVHEVVSGERDQLMQDLTADLNGVMREEFGVQVLDVRVKKIDLPEQVSNSVFERMRSERQVLAREHRARGREIALGIRADADRQQVVIEAEAYRQAEQIRGDGDARAAAIYAQAYERDSEFYQFYRSLAAYREVFSSERDLLLLEPDSEFFKYLKSQRGRDRE